MGELLGIGGGVILLMAMWLGIETKYPRQTGDFYKPDINRAVRREEKAERIREALAARKR